MTACTCSFTSISLTLIRAISACPSRERGTTDGIEGEMSALRIPAASMRSVLSRPRKALMRKAGMIRHWCPQDSMRRAVNAHAPQASMPKSLEPCDWSRTKSRNFSRVSWRLASLPVAGSSQQAWKTRDATSTPTGSMPLLFWMAAMRSISSGLSLVAFIGVTPLVGASCQTKLQRRRRRQGSRRR